MVLPNLTAEQRAAALAKAAEARKNRADAKGALKRGELSLASLLGSQNVHVQKMRVIDLVRSMPGVGKVKADQVMEQVGIAVNRSVAGLGVIQRQALIEHFER